MIRRALDWLHEQTGYRNGVRHLLEEPLPPGTGWWFTLGSVLLFLFVLQFATGAFLTLYYGPTPDHAYDSVRFITRDVAFGALVRGLHYFGASFFVIFSALHLLRVVAFGSYKRPRQTTWISGVVLLVLVLAFSLTGYLLPWDQRAYWATVVTIQMAASTPFAGDLIAWVMRGGPDIGALTLSRWYAVHVIFLPAALVAFLVLHVFLLRRHGIAGPVRPRAGVPRPFFPEQAIRDIAVVGAVAVTLIAFALKGMPPLESVADPSDATYVPRPEWYFLGLFELLKYFPGRLEVIAAVLIPFAAVVFLIVLPWLDRGPERHPLRRPIVGVVAAGTAALVVLTVLGMADSPGSRRRDASRWSERQLAGRLIANEANCARCHSPTGIADSLPEQAIVRGPDWLEGHVADPEVIAPGIRPAPEINPLDVGAILAYLERAKEGPTPALPDQATRTAAVVFARHCIVCHKLDGDGGTDGPDLSRIGGKHDAKWLKHWITDPTKIHDEAEMPAFGDKLSEDELTAISGHLASKK